MPPDAEWWAFHRIVEAKHRLSIAIHCRSVNERRVRSGGLHSGEDYDGDMERIQREIDAHEQAHKSGFPIEWERRRRKANCLCLACGNSIPHDRLHVYGKHESCSDDCAGQGAVEKVRNS